MFITIDSSFIELHEANEFSDFHFEVPNGNEPTQVDGVAIISETELAISPDLVLELAGDNAKNPSWKAQFDGMITYASQKGWITEEGYIKGHVVTR